MIIAVKLTGTMDLADLRQAIEDLRAAGCPWSAPVKTAANIGIDIEWAPPPADEPDDGDPEA